MKFPEKEKLNFIKHKDIFTNWFTILIVLQQLFNS